MKERGIYYTIWSSSCNIKHFIKENKMKIDRCWNKYFMVCFDKTTLINYHVD